MNPGPPLNRVATEPSTIRDVIRMHAALDARRPAIVCIERPPLRFGELDRTGTTTPARRYSQALSRMNCRAEMQGAECDSVTR